MSGSTSLTPPPIKLGAMWSTDTDGAWQIDATANMARRGTTIASVGTPTIQRQDGVAMGSGDLTVTGQAPTADGTGWTFSAQTQGNTGVYEVGFPLTLTNGDIITRWAIIPSVPLIG